MSKPKFSTILVVALIMGWKWIDAFKYGIWLAWFILSIFPPVLTLLFVNDLHMLNFAILFSALPLLLITSGLRAWYNKAKQLAEEE